MLRQVICVNEFSLMKYDDDGYAADDYINIPKGTIFNWDDTNSHRIIGGEVYLENNEQYIEVSYDTLKRNFKEVKDV